MATNFPFIINMYPQTLKVIFGKQKKVSHSLILWTVNLKLRDPILLNKMIT